MRSTFIDLEAVVELKRTTEPQYEPEPTQDLELANISDIELDKNILFRGFIIKIIFFKEVNS